MQNPGFFLYFFQDFFFHKRLETGPLTMIAYDWEEIIFIFFLTAQHGTAFSLKEQVSDILSFSASGSTHYLLKVSTVKGLESPAPTLWLPA